MYNSSGNEERTSAQMHTITPVIYVYVCLCKCKQFQTRTDATKKGENFED